MNKKITLITIISIIFTIILIVPKNADAKETNFSEVDEKSTLIVETEDKTVFEKYDNILSVDEISEGIYCINYEDEQKAQQDLKKLEESDLIEAVCSDVKVSMLGSNVSALSVSSNRYAWGVKTTGINHYLSKLNYNKNKSEVKIAVFDTGIKTSHEVFFNDDGSSKIDLSGSYNYINSNSNIVDDNGHGTQVAGIIAQSTPENVKIIPVKVLDNNGDGKLSSILTAVSDIKDKANIVNLSLGIDPGDLNESALSFCEKIFKNAYDAGVIIICASGNEGINEVCYPALSKYTIAVSAIDYQKQIAEFSNYGKEVDFALPGVDLIVPYSNANSSYGYASGTSFSSPFLSAAVALIKSENYNYTITQVLNVLKENAEDLGPSGKDIYYGYGSLNFDTNMFATPVITDVLVEQEKHIVSIYAISGSNIINYAVTKTETVPNNTEWVNVDIVSTYVNFNANVGKDGTYYVWLKNEEGNVANKKVVVKEKEIYEIFEDVKKDEWYCNAISYVYKNNIIKGYDTGLFGVNDKLTRGQLVTILHRMEKSPKVTGKSKFPDVQDSSQYYYNAVIWATNNKIISGYENGKFGPEDNITREQLAVILWKYARYKGKDISKTNDLKGFGDSNKISAWAKEQVKWAVAVGVITGNNNTTPPTINPLDTATRAEVAAMMEKYCKKVGR